jgi:hypothetical protein
MPPSAIFSIASYVLAPNRCRSYKDGVVVGECVDHVDQTAHTLVAILALATAGFRVDRYEERTGPGGTLLYSEDFGGTAGTVPAGWTQHNAEGAVDGSGKLLIVGDFYSSGIYRTRAVGAAYFELQGCIFDDESHGPHWGMIAPYWAGAGYGEDSYRVLIREHTPHDVEIPDCTPVALTGWSVGSVRIG